MNVLEVCTSHLNDDQIEYADLAISEEDNLMEVFTLKEWEDNFDELFSRVENGETIGIVKKMVKQQ